MLGLYIHIPFCLSKCGYCDFHSVIAGDELAGNYLAALKREITWWAETFVRQSLVPNTLYIGGGTPTCLNAYQLAELLAALETQISWQSGAEKTIEANPGTLDAAKSQLLVEWGVTRVSLGVQAFQDRLLRQIGRIHRVDQVYQSVDLLRRSGINDLNLDLISGLPGQTLDDWRESLAAAVMLAPRHLSCYSLTVEPGTGFFARLQRGDLELPAEDEEVAMFALTHQYLPEQGYQHYEISNFARPGWEARHNLIYWHNLPYVGMGSGAHGYWQGARYSQTKDIQAYIHGWLVDNRPTYDSWEQIDREDAMDETMMVGLRLLSGVSDCQFSQRFGVSFFQVYRREIDYLLAQKLVQVDGDTLKLTEKGLFLGNQVFAAFIRP